MIKKLSTTLLALIIATWAIVVPVQADIVKKPFKDVSSEYPYYDIIHEMRDQNIINGYEDGTFRAQQVISRKHVAALIVRAKDLIPVKPFIKFNDISEINPYFEAIKSLQQAGIFEPDSKGNFNRDQALTRAEMAKVLSIAFNLKGNVNHEFHDVPANHPENEYINALYANGITTGDNGYFKPDAPLTRAHYAVFMHRSMNKANEHDEITKPIPTPNKSYSIHDIVIGEQQSKVESLLGKPNRKSLNEYNIEWHTYHDQYNDFFMVGYWNGKVATLYTNSDLFFSKQGIGLHTKKEEVEKLLGKPNQERLNQHAIYLIGHQNITFFYDQHNEKKVTSIEMISSELAQSIKQYYAAPNQALQDGFEFQMFDLVNSIRSRNGQSILKWDANLANVSRAHSRDMARNDFFSHTNLAGQSPGDRMWDSGINYRVMSENISYGYKSSIYSHEGLMNSAGHRTNILHNRVENVGIGVSFNNGNTPYFTQMYYKPLEF